MTCKMISLSFCGLLVAASLSGTAYADFIFSGSGSSGHLVGPTETWLFDNGGGSLNNWGSPGVGAGVVAYGEATPAFGFEITFTGGGTIDSPSIALGNVSACVGLSGGGTTFCTFSPTDIWMATQTGPDSIAFLAQNPTFFLSTGQDYFVNIFFDGATPTAFTGKWVTTFTPSVPEPSTFVLLGSGLVGLCSKRFWKKS